MPDYVLAGEIYRSSFIVANAGNTPINAVLNIKSAADFAFAVDAARIALMPGDAKIVVASVRTPEALGVRVSHVLRLTASPEGSPEVTATAASSTEVLPRISTGEDPYITIPSVVDVEGSYKYEDETNDELQADLSYQGMVSLPARQTLFLICFHFHLIPTRQFTPMQPSFFWPTTHPVATCFSETGSILYLP